MLSRVAQRVYWFGRYMERAENIARIINVNSNLLFDLPKGTRISWYTLVEILGSQSDYSDRHTVADERSVMKYLIADQTNNSSLITTLKLARENVRTTREILPANAWEHINDLYLLLENGVAEGVSRKNRYSFLQDIIAISQQLTGMLSSTMSNNDAYDFIRLGRNLERADMTTRIIDIGFESLLPHLLDEKDESETITQYEPILWMNILISLSADQMYRQHMQNRVTGPDVVKYILTDIEFPRALRHCLNQMQACLNKLPKGNKIAKSIETINTKIESKNIPKLMVKGLNDFLDEVQIDLAEINNQVEQKWFLT